MAEGTIERTTQPSISFTIFYEISAGNPNLVAYTTKAEGVSIATNDAERDTLNVYDIKGYIHPSGMNDGYPRLNLSVFALQIMISYRPLQRNRP